MIGVYDIVLIGQVVSTIFMVGLIWLVQVVHYPLFAEVGADHFLRYHKRHQTLITWVVAPVMALELTTAIGILVVRPPDITASLLWIGLVLLAVIWLSTWFLQVPAHRKLTTSYSRRQVDRLVSTNWIRTLAWSLRAGLIIAIACQSY